MGGRLPVPGYAIDDETAIKVIDGAVEVVSEGHWKLSPPTRSKRTGGARREPGFSQVVVRASPR